MSNTKQEPEVVYPNQSLPFVTLKHYAFLTGQTIKAVKGQADRGQIPLRDSRMGGPRMVNMRALEKQADVKEW